MRCPKCGYNSFDHLENCKKCGKDLSDHKSRFGIKSVLLASAVAEIEEPAPPEAEPAEIEAAAEAVAESSVEEAAVAESAEDYEFDFVDGEQQKEDLAFDELFEEAPPEDDLEETLPEPDQAEASGAEPAADEADPFDSFDPSEISATDDAGFAPDMNLDDRNEDFAAADFDDEEADDSEKEVLTLDQPDLGLDEVEETASSADEDTELGLDEDDIAEFADREIEGTSEDPDNPFGGKKDLHREGSSIIEKAVYNSRPDDEPVDFLTDQAASDQQDLFAGDEQLPPLPGTRLGEQPAETLEATYGGSYDNAPGASDDFSLGALPGAELADIPDVRTAASGRLAADDSPTDSEESGPVADDAEDLEPVAGTAPPFVRRFSAFLCDVILIGLTGLCFVVVAEMALSDNPGLVPTVETMIDLSIPYFLVVFCLTFGYFTLFHFLTGQTPGKMLTGMRVETFSGEALAFSQAFMRSVGGLIQILPAGLGYLTIFTAGGRGWNDRLAGTRLVDLKSGEESRENQV